MKFSALLKSHFNRFNRTLIRGIVAIYKPKGLTSHQVIERLRKITGVRRIGHAGTLDPFAAGVLVVGIGRASTRELHQLVLAEKEYRAQVRLGMTSTTDDPEGEKRTISVQRIPDRDEIEACLRQFIGRIPQIPPRFSAVKIRGQEAYKRARRGETFRIKPRWVEIKTIELLSYRWPNFDLRVVTGPGTYIRALARDIGHYLGTGAYLAELERTRVGEFTIEQALQFEALSKH